MKHRFLLVAFLLVGCMERGTPAPSPPVYLVSVTKEMSDILQRERTEIAALARSVARLDPDAAKTAWNTGYPPIVDKSANALQAVLSRETSKPLSPESRIALWESIADAYSK